MTDHLFRGQPSRQLYNEINQDRMRVSIFRTKRKSSKPELHDSDFPLPFRVQANASDCGLGIVLSVENSQGQEYPRLYLSRKFSSAEIHCTTSEELVANLYALRKLHYYLDGVNSHWQPTIVILLLQRHASTNPRLIRWVVCL